MSGDLTEPAVRSEMPERPLRVYPALLSTEAEATAWARAGAAAGALVTAGYQVSPRGRAGTPWRVELGRGLGLSLVLRPALSRAREGWPYVAASLALGDVLPAGPGATGAQPEWPDAVLGPDGQQLAALGLATEPAGDDVGWVVVTVLVPHADPPRAPLLRAVVEAVERRVAEPPGAVLEEYRARCRTLGRPVVARMIPLGPAGPQVAGTAVDVLDDGALVLLTERGSRVAVRPQDLGTLESATQQMD